MACYANILDASCSYQWHSQNAEKVKQIKERLLVILFNCIPFQNGNFL